jgi:methionyl-tRNA formyltransferase
MRLASSAVAQAAERLGLPLLKPATLRDFAAVEALRRLDPDVMVVAAYGLILPPEVLGIPARGCINIHASLLPRWRGAAPIQRALLAGDAQTGITLMQMDAGLDTGGILSAHVLPIGARETTGSLTEALAALGARALVEALARLAALSAMPQDAATASYAAKITKGDARIDWNRPADEIDRQVRALNPVPGAETGLDGGTLKIWEASPAPGAGNPGEVLEAQADRLVIGCGAGALRLHKVQRPGGKRLGVAEFLRGTPLACGTRLETALPGVA